ncbi:MAG: DedD protein [Porticoccus sp.]
MNDGLKQRLVGATVLIALSIIFWPIFMGTEQSRHVVIEASIPDAPKFERFEIKPANPNPNIKPVGSYQQKLAAEQAEKAPLNDSKVLDNSGLPTSWVIQLGAFSDQANIDKLVANLRVSKYKVFTDKFAKDGEALTKIFVGPFVELKEADSKKQAIDKQYKLNSTVEKFIP